MNGSLIIGVALLLTGAFGSLGSIAFGFVPAWWPLMRTSRDQAPLLFWGQVAFSGMIAVIGASFIIAELFKRLAA